MDIMEHECLVYSIVNKFFGKNREKEDLIQEGFIGLLKADKTWDKKRNFATYAYKCIKNEILQYIGKQMKREREVFFSDCENVELIEPRCLMKIDEEEIKLEKHQEIADMLIQGYRQCEIAKMQGKSKQLISRNVQEIKEMVKS